MTRTNQRRIADEVRKAKTMQIRNRITQTGIGLALVLMMAGSTYGLNRYFTVSGWSVALDSPTSLPLEQMIEAELAEMPQMDFWHSRPALLREQLMRNIADLADVQIRRKLPHALDIRATARIPVALWQKEAGKVFLVDATGHAYRQLAAHEDADLPVLRMTQHQLTDAGRALRQMQQAMPRHFADVSEILASDRDWKFNFSRGQQWLVSAEEMARNPFASLAALLDRPRWQAGQWRIDMRIENRWFLRPSREEGVI